MCASWVLPSVTSLTEHSVQDYFVYEWENQLDKSSKKTNTFLKFSLALILSPYNCIHVGFLIPIIYSNLNYNCSNIFLQIRD